MISRYHAFLSEERHVPGATFAVVKDGEVIFKKGYGFAHMDTKEAVDPDQTVFFAGSVSKLFTSTAILMHSRLFTQHPKLEGMCYGFYEYFKNDLRIIRHAGDINGYGALLILIPQKYSPQLCYQRRPIYPVLQEPTA